MKKPSGPRSNEPAQSLVDVAAIDQLAKILAKHQLSEIEIDQGELHVRLARERGVAEQQAAAMPAPAPAAVASPTAGEVAPAASMEVAAADPPGAVKSPMVGTAYLRASPEAKPFVEIGSAVKAGDKLLLVEAMKTFNDIVAPRPGKIVDILVADGTPVEYGQPLMVIE
jgi:acetyl-CoA carboxylase biotin carboxyl carrier protein